MLVDRLRECGKSVVQTKEPDGGHIGREIRAILTAPQRTLSPVEQLLLVSAARYDHVRSVVRPALDAGKWVISDRYLDSTFAFQVAVSATELGPLYDAARKVVVDTTMPDRTIVLDIPLRVAQGRRTQRGQVEVDPSEATRDFRLIRDALLNVAARDADRCRIIDGDQPISTVGSEIWKVIQTML